MDNTTGTVPGSSDEGLINVDGTYTSNNWTARGAFTQTGGNIVGNGNSNFNFSGVGASYTMTGGSFSSRGLLANGSTVEINLLGGTWTVGNGSNGSGFGAGNNGTLNIGGNMIINNSRTTAHNYASDGTIAFAADWTGSWENDTVDLAAWKAQITNGSYELAGTVIDSAVFDNNFVVTGNTLSLAVPEPSSAALLGLGGLALALRRRK